MLYLLHLFEIQTWSLHRMPAAIPTIIELGLTVPMPSVTVAIANGVARNRMIGMMMMVRSTIVHLSVPFAWGHGTHFERSKIGRREMEQFGGWQTGRITTVAGGQRGAVD